MAFSTHRVSPCQVQTPVKEAAEDKQWLVPHLSPYCNNVPLFTRSESEVRIWLLMELEEQNEF